MSKFSLNDKVQYLFNKSFGFGTQNVDSEYYENPKTTLNKLGDDIMKKTIVPWATLTDPNKPYRIGLPNGPTVSHVMNNWNNLTYDYINDITKDSGNGSLDSFNAKSEWFGYYWYRTSKAEDNISQNVNYKDQIHIDRAIDSYDRYKGLPIFDDNGIEVPYLRMFIQVPTMPLVVPNPTFEYSTILSDKAPTSKFLPSDITFYQGDTGYNNANFTNKKDVPNEAYNIENITGYIKNGYKDTGTGKWIFENIQTLSNVSLNTWPTGIMNDFNVNTWVRVTFNSINYWFRNTIVTGNSNKEVIMFGEDPINSSAKIFNNILTPEFKNYQVKLSRFADKDISENVIKTASSTKDGSSVIDLKPPQLNSDRSIADNQENWIVDSNTGYITFFSWKNDITQSVNEFETPFVTFIKYIGEFEPEKLYSQKIKYPIFNTRLDILRYWEDKTKYLKRINVENEYYYNFNIIGNKDLINNSLITNLNDNSYNNTINDISKNTNIDDYIPVYNNYKDAVKNKIKQISNKDIYINVKNLKKENIKKYIDKSGNENDIDWSSDFETDPYGFFKINATNDLEVTEWTTGNGVINNYPLWYKLTKKISPLTHKIFYYTNKPKKIDSLTKFNDYKDVSNNITIDDGYLQELTDNVTLNVNTIIFITKNVTGDNYSIDYGSKDAEWYGYFYNYYELDNNNINQVDLYNNDSYDLKITVAPDKTIDIGSNSAIQIPNNNSNFRPRSHEPIFSVADEYAEVPLNFSDISLCDAEIIQSLPYKAFDDITDFHNKNFSIDSQGQYFIIEGKKLRIIEQSNISYPLKNIFYKEYFDENITGTGDLNITGVNGNGTVGIEGLQGSLKKDGTFENAYKETDSLNYNLYVDTYINEDLLGISKKFLLKEGVGYKIKKNSKGSFNINIHTPTDLNAPNKQIRSFKNISKNFVTINVKSDYGVTEDSNAEFILLRDTRKDNPTDIKLKHDDLLKLEFQKKGSYYKNYILFNNSYINNDKILDVNSLLIPPDNSDNVYVKGFHNKESLYDFIQNHNNRHELSYITNNLTVNTLIFLKTGFLKLNDEFIVSDNDTTAPYNKIGTLSRTSEIFYIEESKLKNNSTYKVIESNYNDIIKVENIIDKQKVEIYNPINFNKSYYFKNIKRENKGLTRSNAKNGMIRYNTQLESFEGYSSNEWKPIGGGGVMDSDKDTLIKFTSDDDIDSDSMHFVTDGIERMVINSLGKIAIGKKTNDIGIDFDINAVTKITPGLKIDGFLENKGKTDLIGDFNVLGTSNLKGDVNIKNGNINIYDTQGNYENNYPLLNIVTKSNDNAIAYFSNLYNLYLNWNQKKNILKSLTLNPKKKTKSVLSELNLTDFDIEGDLNINVSNKIDVFLHNVYLNDPIFTNNDSLYSKWTEYYVSNIYVNQDLNNLIIQNRLSKLSNFLEITDINTTVPIFWKNKALFDVLSDESLIFFNKRNYKLPVYDNHYNEEPVKDLYIDMKNINNGLKKTDILQVYRKNNDNPNKFDTWNSSICDISFEDRIEISGNLIGKNQNYWISNKDYIYTSESKTYLNITDNLKDIYFPIYSEPTSESFIKYLKWGDNINVKNDFIVSYSDYLLNRQPLKIEDIKDINSIKNYYGTIEYNNHIYYYLNTINKYNFYKHLDYDESTIYSPLLSHFNNYIHIYDLINIDNNSWIELLSINLIYYNHSDDDTIPLTINNNYTSYNWYGIFKNKYTYINGIKVNHSNQLSYNSILEISGNVQNGGPSKWYGYFHNLEKINNKGHLFNINNNDKNIFTIDRNNNIAFNCGDVEARSDFDINGVLTVNKINLINDDGIGIENLKISTLDVNKNARFNDEVVFNSNVLHPNLNKVNYENTVVSYNTNDLTGNNTVMEINTQTGYVTIGKDSKTAIASLDVSGGILTDYLYADNFKSSYMYTSHLSVVGDNTLDVVGPTILDGTLVHKNGQFTNDTDIVNNGNFTNMLNSTFNGENTFNNQIKISTEDDIIPLSIDSRSAIQLPYGSTSERPDSNIGMLRFNNENNNLECYFNNKWNNLYEIVDGNSSITIDDVYKTIDFKTNNLVTMQIDNNGSININDILNTQLNINRDTYVKSDFNISGNLNIDGDINLAGSLIQKNINVTVEEKTSEQMLITNDGSGPALVINQIGNEDILVLKDDDKTVLTVADNGHVGINIIPENDYILTISGNIKNLGDIKHNGKIGIETLPEFSLDISSTDAIKIPCGNTFERPQAKNGLIRYNSELNIYEAFSNDAWINLAGLSDINLDTFVDVNHNDTIKFVTKSLKRMEISDNGSIGINTNPDSSYILNVEGNVNLNSSNIDISSDKFQVNKISISSNNNYYSIQNDASDAIALPFGNDLQRPENVRNGLIRYNTQQNIIETYHNNNWYNINGNFNDLKDTFIDISNDKNIYINTNNNERININNKGNIHLSKADDNNTLTISGITYVDKIISKDTNLNNSISINTQGNIFNNGINQFEGNNILNGITRINGNKFFNGFTSIEQLDYINVIEGNENKDLLKVTKINNKNVFSILKNGKILINKEIIENGYDINISGNLLLDSNTKLLGDFEVDGKVKIFNETEIFNNLIINSSNGIALDISSNSALSLPKGSINERPNNKNGLIRLNTDINQIEYNNNGNWYSLINNNDQNSIDLSDNINIIYKKNTILEVNNNDIEINYDINVKGNSKFKSIEISGINLYNRIKKFDDYSILFNHIDSNIYDLSINTSSLINNTKFFANDISDNVFDLDNKFNNFKTSNDISINSINNYNQSISGNLLTLNTEFNDYKQINNNNIENINIYNETLSANILSIDKLLLYYKSEIDQSINNINSYNITISDDLSNLDTNFNNYKSLNDANINNINNYSLDISSNLSSLDTLFKDYQITNDQTIGLISNNITNLDNSFNNYKSLNDASINNINNYSLDISSNLSSLDTLFKDYQITNDQTIGLISNNITNLDNSFNNYKSLNDASINNINDYSLDISSNLSSLDNQFNDYKSSNDLSLNNINSEITRIESLFNDTSNIESSLDGKIINNTTLINDISFTLNQVQVSLNNQVYSVSPGLSYEMVTNRTMIINERNKIDDVSQNLNNLDISFTFNKNNTDLSLNYINTEIKRIENLFNDTSNVESSLGSKITNNRTLIDDVSQNLSNVKTLISNNESANNRIIIDDLSLNLLNLDTKLSNEIDNNTDLVNDISQNLSNLDISFTLNKNLIDLSLNYINSEIIRVENLVNTSNIESSLDSKITNNKTFIDDISQNLSNLDISFVLIKNHIDLSLNDINSEITRIDNDLSNQKINIENALNSKIVINSDLINDISKNLLTLDNSFNAFKTSNNIEFIRLDGDISNLDSKLSTQINNVQNTIQSTINNNNNLITDISNNLLNLKTLYENHELESNDNIIDDVSQNLSNLKTLFENYQNFNNQNISGINTLNNDISNDLNILKSSFENNKVIVNDNINNFYNQLNTEFLILQNSVENIDLGNIQNDIELANSEINILKSSLSDISTNLNTFSDSVSLFNTELSNLQSNYDNFQLTYETYKTNNNLTISGLSNYSLDVSQNLDNLNNSLDTYKTSNNLTISGLSNYSLDVSQNLDNLNNSLETYKTGNNLTISGLSNYSLDVSQNLDNLNNSLDTYKTNNNLIISGLSNYSLDVSQNLDNLNNSLDTYKTNNNLTISGLSNYSLDVSQNLDNLNNSLDTYKTNNNLTISGLSNYSLDVSQNLDNLNNSLETYKTNNNLINNNIDLSINSLTEIFLDFSNNLQNSSLSLDISLTNIVRYNEVNKNYEYYNNNSWTSLDYTNNIDSSLNTIKYSTLTSTDVSNIYSVINDISSRLINNVALDNLNDTVNDISSRLINNIALDNLNDTVNDISSRLINNVALDNLNNTVTVLETSISGLETRNDYDNLKIKYNLGIGTDNPIYSLDISDNKGIRISSGTMINRPNNPQEGLIRYNKDLKDIEIYTDSWNIVGSNVSRLDNTGEIRLIENNELGLFANNVKYISLKDNRVYIGNNTSTTNDSDIQLYGSNIIDNKLTGLGLGNPALTLKQSVKWFEGTGKVSEYAYLYNSNLLTRDEHIQFAKNINSYLTSIDNNDEFETINNLLNNFDNTDYIFTDSNKITNYKWNWLNSSSNILPIKYYENIDNGGWLHVRRINSNNTWYEQNNNLDLSTDYGIYKLDSLNSNSFSLNYDNLTDSYDEILIATSDNGWTKGNETFNSGNLYEYFFQYDRVSFDDHVILANKLGAKPVIIDSNEKYQFVIDNYLNNPRWDIVTNDIKIIFGLSKESQGYWYNNQEIIWNNFNDNIIPNTLSKNITLNNVTKKWELIDNNIIGSCIYERLIDDNNIYNPRAWMIINKESLDPNNPNYVNNNNIEILKSHLYDYKYLAPATIKPSINQINIMYNNDIINTNTVSFVPFGDYEYYFNNEQLSYEEHVIKASNEYNSNLLYIENEEENNFINTLIENNTIIIGLKYDGIEFKWYNGDSLQYSNWASNEPALTNSEYIYVTYNNLEWFNLPNIDRSSIPFITLKYNAIYKRIRKYTSVLYKENSSKTNLVHLGNDILLENYGINIFVRDGIHENYESNFYINNINFNNFNLNDSYIYYNFNDKKIETYNDNTIRLPAIYKSNVNTNNSVNFNNTFEIYTPINKVFQINHKGFIGSYKDPMYNIDVSGTIRTNDLITDNLKLNGETVFNKLTVNNTSYFNNDINLSNGKLKCENAIFTAKVELLDNLQITNANINLIGSYTQKGNFNIEGNSKLLGNLDIGDISNSHNLLLYGNSDIKGDLDVNGYIKINGYANIQSDTQIFGSLTIGSLGNNKNVNIYGNNINHGDNTIMGNNIIKGNNDVCGNFTVNSGNTVLNGSLTIQGEQNSYGILNQYAELNIINKNLNSSGIINIGNLKNNGNLSVLGNTILDGELKLLNNLDVSGLVNINNTNIKGDLDIYGDTNISGITNINNLFVKDNVGISGDINILGDIKTYGKSDIGGNMNISGDITIDKNANINNDLTINNGNLNLNGDANIGGALTSSSNTVTGDIYSGGKLDIMGLSNLKNVNIDGNINSIGNNKFLGQNDLSGILDVKGITNINGDINISGSGGIYLRGDMTLLGDMNIKGSFNQKNINVTVEEKTTEQMIVTNDGTGPALIINQIGTEKIVEFKNANDTRFIINNEGFIGLNNDNPNYILDINSNEAIKIPVGDISNRPTNPIEGLIRYNNETNQYEGYSSGIWKGLGGVIDSNLDTKVEAFDDDNIKIFTNGLERLIVNQIGNIGIGKNDISNNYKLDISGNVNIDGNMKLTDIDVNNINSTGKLTINNLEVINSTNLKDIVTNSLNTTNITITGNNNNIGTSTFNGDITVNNTSYLSKVNITDDLEITGDIILNNSNLNDKIDKLQEDISSIKLVSDNASESFVRKLFLDKPPKLENMTYEIYPDRVEFNWSNPLQFGTSIPVNSELLYLPLITTINVEYGVDNFNNKITIGGKDIYNQNKSINMTNKFIIYIDNAKIPSNVSGEEEDISRVYNKCYFTKSGAIDNKKKYNFRFYASNNDPDSTNNFVYVNDISTVPINTTSSPSNLTFDLSYNENSLIILKWEQPSENVKSFIELNNIINIKNYKIDYQYSEISGNIVYSDWETYTTIQHKDTSYQNYIKTIPFDNNKFYKFRVSSNNIANDNYSEHSNIVEVKYFKPDPPTNLNAVYKDNKYITLTWDHPINNNDIELSILPIYKYKLLIDINYNNNYDKEVIISSNIIDSKTNTYDYDYEDHYFKNINFLFRLVSRNIIVKEYSDYDNTILYIPNRPYISNLNTKFYETNNNDYVRFIWDNPDINPPVYEYKITYKIDSNNYDTSYLKGDDNNLPNNYFDFYYNFDDMLDNSFFYTLSYKTNLNNNFSTSQNSQLILNDKPDLAKLNLELFNNEFNIIINKPEITDRLFLTNPEYFEDSQVIDINDYVIIPSISGNILDSINISGNNLNYNVFTSNSIFDNNENVLYDYSIKSKNVLNSLYSDTSNISFKLSKPDNFDLSNINIDWNSSLGVNIDINYPVVTNLFDVNIDNRITNYIDELKIEVYGIPNPIINNFSNSFNDKIISNLERNIEYDLSINARNRFNVNYNDIFNIRIKMKEPNIVSNVNIDSIDIRYLNQKNSIQVSWNIPVEKGFFINNIVQDSPNIHCYNLKITNLNDLSDNYNVNIFSQNDNTNPEESYIFKTGDIDISNNIINIKPNTQYKIDIKSSNVYYKDYFSDISSILTINTPYPENPNTQDVNPNTALNKISILGNYPRIDNLIDNTNSYNNIINVIQIDNNNQINLIGNIDLIGSSQSTLNTLSLNNQRALINDTLSFKLFITEMDSNTIYESNEIKYNINSLNNYESLVIDDISIGKIYSNNILDSYSLPGFDNNNLGHWYQGDFSFIIDFNNFTNNYLGHPINLNMRLSYYDGSNNLEGYNDSSLNIIALDNFNSEINSFISSINIDYNDFKIFGIPFIKRDSGFDLSFNYDISGVSKYYTLSQISSIKLKSDTQDYTSDIIINYNYEGTSFKIEDQNWSINTNLDSNNILHSISKLDNQIKLVIKHGNINTNDETVINDKLFIYDQNTFDLYDQQSLIDINQHNNIIFMDISLNIDPINNFDQEMFTNINKKTNFEINSDKLLLYDGKFITPTNFNYIFNLSDINIINKYKLNELANYTSDDRYRYCMFKYRYKHIGSKVDIGSFGFKLLNTNIILSDIQVNNNPNVSLYAKVSFDDEETIWYKLNSNSGANPGSTATIIGNNDYPFNGLVNLINEGENPASIPNTIDGKTFLNWSLGNENIYSYTHLFKNIRSTSQPVDFIILIGIKSNIDRYISGIQFLGINI